MIDTVTHLHSQLELVVGQHSSAGIKGENEDAIGIRIPAIDLLTTKGAVALLADGVSGAEAGREASETCIHNFLSDYYSTPESWSVKNSAHKVLTSLNRWLYGQSQRFSHEHKGYLSTLSAVIFKSQSAHIFHVGDSRISRKRHKEFEVLTRDHSLVVSEEKSYLTRAMGLDINLDVDYQKIDLELGDVFILTTDGVHDFMSPEEIADVVEMLSTDLDRASKFIIESALAKGSDDNLSCQIIRIDNLPKQQVNEVISKLTALPFPPHLESGMVVDGLQVVKEIYASNRSQLYLVEDIESGMPYCMKTPSVNFDDDPAYIERFVMESWIGNRIINSNVVKVVELNRKKSCLYYLTEYIEGQTLSQWIKENPKPAVLEVVNFSTQIAKGIQAFHRRETFHQDIKPDNILIDKNGVVKILDFGSCFVAGIAEIASPIEKDVVLGTASYSAPEYTVHGEINYQSDLFSLAVICYEMLTGQLPFGGKLEDCRSKRDFLNTVYTPSYHLNPLVPLWMDGALKKALRFMPERRHQEISEFIHELKHPNPKYLDASYRPLIEKDPLLFWKTVSAALLVLQLLTLYFLS